MGISILAVQYVVDRTSERLICVKMTRTPTPCPDSTFVRNNPSVAKHSGRPRLQLPHRPFGVPVEQQHNMDMIASDVYGFDRP